MHLYNDLHMKSINFCVYSILFLYSQNRPNKLKRQDHNGMNTGTKDFHCVTCESSFRTEFDLNGHMSQHRQVL